LIAIGTVSLLQYYPKLSTSYACILKNLIALSSKQQSTRFEIVQAQNYPAKWA